MLRKLIAVVALSLLLLPGVALAFEPGDQAEDEEEFVLYDGTIEPAESTDPVREIGDAPVGVEAGFVEADEHGVNR